MTPIGGGQVQCRTCPEKMVQKLGSQHCRETIGHPEMFDFKYAAQHPEHPQHSPVNSLQQQPGPSGESPPSEVHPHHDPNHSCYLGYGCNACPGSRFFTPNEFGRHVSKVHMTPIGGGQVQCRTCPEKMVQKLGSKHCKSTIGHPKMFKYAAQPVVHH